jgi:hypothetical protein
MLKMQRTRARRTQDVESHKNNHKENTKKNMYLISETVKQDQEGKGGGGREERANTNSKTHDGPVIRDNEPELLAICAGISRP